MFVKTIGRILYVTYPLLIFAVALTAWSSSSLSELAYVTLPNGDGLNFSWKPSFVNQSACNQSTKLNQNYSCSISSDGARSWNELTKTPNQTFYKAN